MMILKVKRMKNSASGNPNWIISNGTSKEVIDTLIKQGIIKFYENKKIGIYLRTKPNLSFSYQIANNAILEINNIKFRCEIV